MAWIVLVAAGMMEAVWATALSESKGFKRRKPTILFILALALSMAGLAWAMLSLPTGTAYAVWVGIGASLTLVWGFIRGEERFTVARSLLLVLLLGSVVGLKAVS
ncbi:DMT family transporter [Glycomyces algeriensis]|uniref:QacE family quaternary ammonium compound efflux SMR transporter n=1 Tax=Glycomyces algeriensis TaxID=256037 RepID=A0A9W6GAI0_9ACTN|nr:SMR family transporter [Glycomyces algeriensis]MDA1364483.1 SMR family transporter [Glycomyces algeriensis]MDR7350516.1 quaternary ammonium compound-resistance protein SugE [Glycomyces algeriensis]GLI43224.1 QacE family quaternary ammonium compound efflux SMR transporter [Glycomyces algeriensis]